MIRVSQQYRRSIDITGQTRKHLTVIEPVGYNSAKSLVWRCRCDCGKEVRIRTTDFLHPKKYASCGCKGKRHTKLHGLSRINAPTRGHYMIWKEMIRRCTDPSNAAYARYGGRGISVCDRWLASCQAFIDDIGPRPKGTTLDRIDNNGNYEPGNCRWATFKEQARNTRSCRMIEIDGVSRSLSEWVERMASPVNYNTVLTRIQRGWPVREAIVFPAGERRPTC
jgi:hypothetical protein